MSAEARHNGRVPERGTSRIRRIAVPKPRPSLAFADIAGLVSC